MAVLNVLLQDCECTVVKKSSVHGAFHEQRKNKSIQYTQYLCISIAEETPPTKNEYRKEEEEEEENLPYQKTKEKTKNARIVSDNKVCM